MIVDRATHRPPSWKPWSIGGWLVLVALSGVPLFAGDVRAADSRRGQPKTGPSTSSCSDACDKKASDCVDVCEEKFKDDKPRVQCKMACIADREKCEKECK